MRKLYLFVNINNGRGWLDCLSLTDDGHILGNHICSELSYMRYDLHDRIDRLEKIKAHFAADPYSVEVLDYEACKTHEDFQKAIGLASTMKHDVEKAGVTVEFSEE